jgi:hypothetical protein
MAESGNTHVELSPEEAQAKGLYFHDGRWITHAEAKDLLDRYHISKDVRRLANYYYILVGCVGIGICLILTYLAFARNDEPALEELLKLSIFGIVCGVAICVGIGLRGFKPWARRLGFVFYPGSMGVLFLAALVTGRLEGQILAALALAVPLAISFGVLSYLTLYGEGAEKVFDQLGKGPTISHSDAHASNSVSNH